MKIELYLRNINQDMIDDRQMRMGRDWRVVVPIWKVSFLGTPFEKKGQKYLLRAEKEGGMLFDPKTSAVYKLDEEAYHTLIEMGHFEDSRRIAERLNIDKEKVEQFKKELGELKII
ncbi:MAG: hypothetical protein ACFFCW_07240 [Candidatus Hodarchaeota archaeon]